MQVRMSEELIAVATETCDVAMDTKTVEKDIATVIKVSHLFFQLFELETLATPNLSFF